MKVQECTRTNTLRFVIVNGESSVARHTLFSAIDGAMDAIIARADICCKITTQIRA